MKDFDEKILADLTPQPIKEGSRLTNDPLQIALAQYAKEIARTGKVFHHLGRECDKKED